MFLVFPFLVEMLVQPWFTLFYHEIIFQIIKIRLIPVGECLLNYLLVFRVKMRFLADSNQKLPFGHLDSKHQSATASWCDNYTDLNFEN